MYKSTRHTNKSWTYAPESLGAYVAVREDQAAQLLSESETLLKKLSLQDPTDFVHHCPDSGPMRYTRFVNGWLRRGRAYLRKVGAPSAVIVETPNWLLLAPKLGKALRRINDKQKEEVIADLWCIHSFLLQRNAPRGPRPTFSSRAVRVSAVPQNEKPRSGVGLPLFSRKNVRSSASPPYSQADFKKNNAKPAKKEDPPDNLIQPNARPNPLKARIAGKSGAETAISVAMKQALLRLKG